MSTDPPNEPPDDRVVILNPASGSGDHVEEVHTRSKELGFTVRETEGEGDAIDLARDVARDGATLLGAAGGDGTVNEVVRGIGSAEAFDRVVVGVVPCGTGNDFAGNVGIEGVEHAFNVLERGERRWVDLGFAGDRPFVNSCVGGLTADASAETSGDLKRRFGTFAYVLNTLRTLREFDGIRVSVEAFEAADQSPEWSGEAVAVLVGNGRQFPPGGSRQANMEDGRFDVTLVQDTDPVDLMEKAAVERILGQETPGTTRFTTPALAIHVQEGDPVTFSLDGEVIRRRRLSLRTRPKTLRIAVGERYEPTPEE